MKKILLAGFVAFIVMCMASCGDVFETSDNGKLDGYWHLTEIDTLNSGNVADMSEKRVFWAVQGKILNMYDADYDWGYGYMFRFNHTGSSLILSEPRINFRVASDSLVTDVNVIRRYGMCALSDTFDVERLSSSHMTLKGRRLRLLFRKM